jgi:hypothetical protein
VGRPVFLAAVVLLLAGCGGSSLPYDEVTYDAADARRAFASEQISLILRSQGGLTTTFGSAGDVLEVDIFGESEHAAMAGFKDLPRGADCTVDGHLALHWRGNVRAILDCGLVRNDERWVARLDRALAALD